MKFVLISELNAMRTKLLDELYAAARVQYVLKPKEGMVLNLEYAHDKNDNSGVYLKMGYAYLGEIMEKL